MTVAPSSASIWQQYGPAMRCESSTTLTPARGPDAGNLVCMVTLEPCVRMPSILANLTCRVESHFLRCTVSCADGSRTRALSSRGPDPRPPPAIRLDESANLVCALHRDADRVQALQQLLALAWID